MRALFTLTSSESRRLIAKAVLAMPEVQAAMEKGYVLLAGGTTNAFIAQEILNDRSIIPSHCTAGISSEGVLCVTHADRREGFPNVFHKGEPKPEMSFREAFNDYTPDTVIIKGANAVDMEGHVGIITSGFDGGTVPNILGTTTSKGHTLITPVGLEKLVPSVPKACKALGGAKHLDISMGADPGMYCLSTTEIVTEIEAIRILFDCEATLVAAGGVGGNEGAVTLVADGNDDAVKAMCDFLDTQIKGEPPVPGNKGDCNDCRYPFCRYNKNKPAWMK